MRSTDLGRVRNRIVVGGLCVVLALVVVAYPYVVTDAVETYGVRAVALVGLALFGLPLIFEARARRGLVPVALMFLVLVAAAITTRASFLRLVPSVVYLTLALVCYRSLRDRDSIIERAARYLVPEVPTFIRPYCRKLTGFWVAFFVASAVAIAWLAIREDPAWRVFSGVWLYAAMAGVSVVEFFIRKTWFRYYYHGGLFDQFWSSLFPAENTEIGRQSMVYIAQTRASRRS